jgi:hypothetical protein
MLVGQTAVDRTYRKEIRALAYLWKYTELDRHQAALDRSENPLIQAARKAIEGGAETLSAIAKGSDIPLLAVLDQAHAYRPRPGILKIYQATHEKSLAEDFWPEQRPVMVAPIPDPFGEYDKAPHHTCNTFFRVGGDESGPDAGRLWTGHAWRKNKIGKLDLYCEGCYSKRVARHVEQLTEELRQYVPLDDHPLLYAVMPNEIIQRLVSAKRKQRQRKGDGFIYKVFPLDSAESVLVHNKHGGIQLPTTRIELYELVSGWCRTPDGMKIHGSVEFGLNYQGSKGNGRKRGPAKDADQVGETIAITGPNYGKMAMAARKAGLIPESKGRHRFHQRGGVSFLEGCTWPQLINALDASKVLYKVKEGKEALERLLEECPEKRTVLAPRQNTVPKSGQNQPACGPDLLDKTPFEAVFGGSAT